MLRSIKFAHAAFAALVVVAVVGAAAVPLQAQAPAQTPPPRGFDYWQPDGMMRDLWGPGHMSKGMMTRMLRHSTYMHYGVPKDYDGAQSGVGAGPEVVAAGAALYAQNCARCHGRDGMGDGDAGQGLTPSPALLAYMIRRPISVDEYLLWSISEGGKMFDTVMPAFKDTLPRDDIWKIVAFMRAGFPRDAKP